MEEKSGSYLVMALVSFGFLGLEVLVLFVESLFYGTINLLEVVERQGVLSLLIHWGITCVVWGAGVWFLYVLAKKRDFDILLNKSQAPVKNWIIVFALLAALAAASYFAWDMNFKPLTEFARLRDRLGGKAVAAFIGQYIYYAVESALILSIIVFGQKFGELYFNKTGAPYGGIFCGLTWGLGHVFTQGSLFTGIYTAAVSIAYGAVYLLLKRNIRHAYPVIALMFML